MYRVLIAEDEVFVRLGIKMSVGKNGHAGDCRCCEWAAGMGYI